MGYQNDIYVYAIYAEGSESHNSDWSMDDEGTEWITYQEVSQLWYTYYNPSTGYTTYIYPNCMIVLATVCYGYSGTDGIPHMAKSFVDYGAKAFVGATVVISALLNDLYTDDFWRELYQNDNDLYHATLWYIYAHNLWDPLSHWTYGVHCRIYGDTNAQIPN